MRTATSGDLSAVDALLARSYPKLLKADYPPSVLVLALPRISRTQPGLVTSGTYFVAETPDGQLLGAGGWTRDRRAARHGHVRHVATDADSVRRGIGTRLMRHVLEDAERAGIALMECWSTRGAVPFYESLGFTALGPRDIRLDDAILFPAVHMVATLQE